MPKKLGKEVSEWKQTVLVYWIHENVLYRNRLWYVKEQKKLPKHLTNQSTALH